METGAILAIAVVAALLMLALLVVGGRRARERRIENKRIEAREHREEAALRMDHAEREREAAEERLAEAERERQRALDPTLRASAAQSRGARGGGRQGERDRRRPAPSVQRRAQSRYSGREAVRLCDRAAPAACPSRNLQSPMTILTFAAGLILVALTASPASGSSALNGRIAYTTHGESGNSAQGEIYTLDPDGCTYRLTENPGSDAQPDWSSDGRHLLYRSSSTTRSGGFEVWRMTQYGEAETRLTFSEDPARCGALLLEPAELVSGWQSHLVPGKRRPVPDLANLGHGARAQRCHAAGVARRGHEALVSHAQPGHDAPARDQAVHRSRRLPGDRAVEVANGAGKASWDSETPGAAPEAVQPRRLGPGTGL